MEVHHADLDLGYRTSRLKGDRNVDGEIVLAVRFRLTTDAEEVFRCKVVVIAAGGHGSLGTTPGDSVIAFRLD